jgi:hypothetical protein
MFEQQSPAVHPDRLVSRRAAMATAAALAVSAALACFALPGTCAAAADAATAGGVGVTVSLNGQAFKDKQSAERGAAVALHTPANLPPGDAKSTKVAVIAQVQADGTFVFAGVAPGDYLAVATAMRVREARPAQARVTIVAGQTSVVKLDLRTSVRPR